MNMLLAQAAPNFPPWYFWLFVLAQVIVIFGSITTMAVYATRANMLRRIRERELAAQLIEQMLRDERMTAAEIEQVVNSYWVMGTFWRQLRSQLSQTVTRRPVFIPPQKPVNTRS